MTVPALLSPVDVIQRADRLLPLIHHSVQAPPILQSAKTFKDHVGIFDKWEQRLLQSVQLEAPPEQIVSIILRATSVVITSNRSAKDFHGKFGFVGATNLGARFIRNSGEGPGYQTNSFRAEAYGSLAVVLVIVQIFDYCYTILPSNLHLYSDSLSAIKTIRQYRQYPEFYLNATLDPEWDVFQKIIFLLRQFENGVPIDYVKSHLEEKTLYHLLALEEQLNVNADAMAGQYQYEPDESRTHVPIIHGTGAQVTFPGSTITSKLKRLLRRICKTEPLKLYICRKQKWDDDEFSLIDWESHGTAMQQHYRQKVFFVKFIHDWLPLGRLVSRYRIGITEHCPACGYHNEDRDHMLTCSEDAGWVEDCITELHHWFINFPT